MTRGTSLGCALLAIALGGACQQTLVLDDTSPDGGHAGRGGTGGGTANGGTGGAGPADASSSDGRCFGNQDQPISFTADTPQVVIALDRSSTMTGTPFDPPENEFSAATEDLSAEVSSYAPGNGQRNNRRAISFSYVDFPDDSAKDCASPGSGCCVGAVAPANSYQAFNDATSACDPPNVCIQSANRPIAAALSRARDYYDYGDGSVQTGQRFVLLVTDGTPNGCSTASPPSPPTDCQDALGEINALNELGVTTVIIEVGPQSSTLCLLELATAGSGQSSYSGPLYNAATTPDDLNSVLGTVAGNVAADVCRLTLSMAPESSDQLTVMYGGMMVAPGTTNGWTYNPDDAHLTLHGTACQNFVSNEFGLQIFNGCVSEHTGQGP